MIVINPIRPGLFSHSPGQELIGPDAKNQGYHQPIEMKLGMTHYSHKSVPNAKFESGSFSIFGNMTSQNFTLKRGRNNSSSSSIYPGKMGLTIKQ